MDWKLHNKQSLQSLRLFSDYIAWKILTAGHNQRKIVGCINDFPNQSPPLVVNRL